MQSTPPSPEPPDPRVPPEGLDDPVAALDALSSKVRQIAAELEVEFEVPVDPEPPEEELMPVALVRAARDLDFIDHYEYVSLPRQLLRRVLSVSPWLLASGLWLGIILLALATTLWVMQMQEASDTSVPRTQVLSAISTELDTSDVPASDSMVPSVDAHQVLPEPVPTGTPDAMQIVITTPSVTGPSVAQGVEPSITPVNEAPDYAELQVRLFGVPATASRIVFLVDTSGSLLDTLPYVQRELQRRIIDLSSKQRFTVIFFSGVRKNGAIEPRLLEVPPGGLGDNTLATPKRRNDAVDWIDPDARRIQAGLRGDAVAAIRAAVRYKPEVIFLLSDNITGYGQNPIEQARLLKAVRNANAGQAQIHTIQFVYEDPLIEITDSQTGAPLYRRTLRVLAEQNHGKHVFISEDDLRVMDPGSNGNRRPRTPDF